MSISNSADEKSIDDTVPTTDAASHTSMATFTSQTSPLLHLPVELRTMIWGYIIAGCGPAIGPAVRNTLDSNVRRIVSSDDKKGIYPPHPLCYVCRSVSNETREQIYPTALLTTDIVFYRLDTRMMPQIKRLSLTMDQASYMLNAEIPFIADGQKQPKKELILSNLPGLKYLELVWCLDIRQLVNSKDHPQVSHRRMLTRLYFFRRSFEVEMRLVIYRRSAIAIIGTSLTFRYEKRFKWHHYLEQRLARFICAGDSKEEKEQLDLMVSGINCCRFRRSMLLGREYLRMCTCAGNSLDFCSPVFDE